MSDLQAIALCIALGSVSQAIGFVVLAEAIRRAWPVQSTPLWRPRIRYLSQPPAGDADGATDPIIAELKAARSRRETDSENLNSQLAATSAALRGAL